MKFSKILFKQHIGRQIRSNWFIRGKVKPLETYAEKSLTARGIEIIDPLEYIKPKKQLLDFKTFNFLKPQPIPNDQNHPNWKDRPCFFYEDNDVLIQGLPQAQLITKTILFENVLPDSVEAVKENVLQETHEIVKRIIQTSTIFDAYQELLPKRKDPERPAWNFPRDYGITDVRKILNLSKKFIQLCDCISGPQIANNRSIIDNALLCLPFEKEFNLYNFSLTMDIMLMSEKPLKAAFKVNKDCNIQLPSIHPMHHSIAIRKKNIYKFEELYPIISDSHKKYIHTIFIYLDKTKVKNITQLELTETQIFGRAMIKAFTAAAYSARQRFGSDINELPEPVTIQCIQSDGKTFYFLVYQLNTLDVEGENGLKNYCWTLPKIDLYEISGYKEGKPTLEGYNPEVFNRILAFYKNN